MKRKYKTPEVYECTEDLMDDLLVSSDMIEPAVEDQWGNF